MVNNVRLWPSTTPTGTNPKASNNTVGVEFEVSKNQRLYAVWYYSAPGTTDLPTKTAVWDAAAGTVVSGTVNSSPSWSGAVGSGWVFVSYDGSVTLTAGTKYNATCYDSGTGTWQNRGAAYWTTGAGSAGISNGAVSAPSTAASRIGQGVTAGGDAFPGLSGAGQNFWVDVEVGDAPPSVPGSATLAKSLSASVAATRVAAGAVELSAVQVGAASLDRSLVGFGEPINPSHDLTTFGSPPYTTDVMFDGHGVLHFVGFTLPEPEVSGLTPGITYRLTVSWREETLGTTIVLGFEWLNDARQALGVLEIPAEAGPGWQTGFAEGVAPPNTVTALMFLEIAAAPGVDSYIGQIDFQQVFAEAQGSVAITQSVAGSVSVRRTT